jgi:hypothetical protein
MAKAKAKAKAKATARTKPKPKPKRAAKPKRTTAPAKRVAKQATPAYTSRGTFGYKCAWFAVASGAIKPVADTLLRAPKEIDWDEGCDEAYGGGRLVTPPTNGWVLVASTRYHELVQPHASFRDTLERLSKQFGEAQFFATDRVIGLLGYGLARKGKLVRAFGELDGDRYLDEGAPTPAELTAFRRGRDEETLMKLAGAWSVDPQTLRHHRTGMVAG